MRSNAPSKTQMSAIAARLEQEDPDFGGHWGVNVVPLRQQISGDLRPVLPVLFGAVAFVLLIACAKVSSLLLARAAVSVRWAIRTAIGASRWRIAAKITAHVSAVIAFWPQMTLFETFSHNLALLFILTRPCRLGVQP